jgi:hypothetical protein
MLFIWDLKCNGCAQDGEGGECPGPRGRGSRGIFLHAAACGGGGMSLPFFFCSSIALYAFEVGMRGPLVLFYFLILYITYVLCSLPCIPGEFMALQGKKQVSFSQKQHKKSRKN